MPVMVHRLLLFAILLSGPSCAGSAIDRSRSLVGAKSLPPASTLARETIQIDLRRDKGPTRKTYYELKPDGTWTATALAADMRKRFGSKSVHLDAKQADSAREKLWRLRPAELGGLGIFQVPTNCPAWQVGSSPFASVGFMGHGSRPGKEQVGMVNLPSAENCNSPDAIAARALIEEVMSKLPRLNP